MHNNEETEETPPQSDTAEKEKEITPPPSPPSRTVLESESETTATITTTETETTNLEIVEEEKSPPSAETTITTNVAEIETAEAEVVDNESGEVQTTEDNNDNDNIDNIDKENEKVDDDIVADYEIVKGDGESEIEEEQEQQSTEENTILLPEPDKQLVENVTVMSDAIGEDGVSDEQAISFESNENEANTIQEDVLAEPLGEEDNLYAANIDVKPIEGILVKLETLTDGINNKSGRRRATRKSAAAAAAAIRVKSEHSPESDSEIPRTRSSKRHLKSPMNDDETKYRKKTAKLQKIKLEIESDNEDPINYTKIDSKQCRVCLSKVTLISLFKKEGNHTVADKIMDICNAIKIEQKDNLPQYICNNCVQSVNVAFNLKILCEKTDKELRNKLKKKNTVITIKKERSRMKKELIYDNDGEESIEEDKDGDYVVSHESEQSAVETDSDSDFGSKRKRSLRKKKTSGLKKRGKVLDSSGGGVVVISKKHNRKEKLENGKGDENDNGGIASTDDENSGPSKKKRKRIKSTSKTDDEKKEPKEFTCIYCDQKFTSQNQLREHKKNHVGEKPFTCNICNKPFKLIASYNSHLQKHKEEDNLICGQCDNKQFANKTEFKKHMTEVHNEQQTTFKCDKCKRGFTSQARLDRHKDGKCPGFETSGNPKKDKKKHAELDALAIGRDLFKCVAPMTTTYWSDSFSD